MVKNTAPSLTFEQMQDLITSIYDAALDESNWENVLNKIAHTLQADRGSIRTLDGKSKNVKQALTLNVDPLFTQAYNDYYVEHDPYIDIALNRQGSFLACSHHLISDKEYESMEIYQDFVKPQGHHYGIGGRIDINDGSSCYMTFQRGRKYSGFDLRSIETLKIIIPHIQRAILINNKTRFIELQNDLLSEVLNQINSPICLVNKHGVINYINEKAEILITQYDGISLKNNCISIHSTKENIQLQKLIRHATSKTDDTQLTHGGSMCFVNTKLHSTLSILVSPINADKTNLGTINDEVALILFNTSKHRVSPTVELLMGLYDLTPAEAKLSLYLCKGLTLEEISTKLARSKNTLRSQLRSSFNKVGVSRQSELIHLINTGPAGIIKRK